MYNPSQVQTQLRDARVLARLFERGPQAVAALLEVTSARLAAGEKIDEDSMDDEVDRIRFVLMVAHATLLEEAASDGRFGVDGKSDVIEPNTVEYGLSVEVILLISK